MVVVTVAFVYACFLVESAPCSLVSFFSVCLQDLTKRIASQLRQLVQSGYIGVELLNRHLPMTILQLLNDLLNAVSKLETYQQSLQVGGGYGRGFFSFVE